MNNQFIPELVPEIGIFSKIMEKLLPFLCLQAFILPN